MSRVTVVAAWIVLIVSAALWALFITKAWVKDGAFAYARALLAACESTPAVPAKG